MVMASQTMDGDKKRKRRMNTRCDSIDDQQEGVSVSERKKANSRGRPHPLCVGLRLSPHVSMTNHRN